MNSVSPIFIGGLMRSGTTLLRAMLGQHPAVAAGLETHWFEIDWQAGLARGEEPLRPYLHRIGAFFEFDTATVDRFAEASDSAPDFLDRFMSEVARRSGKPRWAEKTTGNVRHMDRIMASWPDARILHIVRDPKDVFASFRRSAKYGGAADYGMLWCDYFGDVERFKREPAIASALLELRYEDLVSAPAETMSRVLDFIGEPWHPEVAQFEGKADDHDRVQALTGHSSSTLVALAEPLMQSRVGTWSDVISESDMVAARDAVAARGLGPLFAAIEAGEDRIAGGSSTTQQWGTVKR